MLVARDRDPLCLRRRKVASDRGCTRGFFRRERSQVEKHRQAFRLRPPLGRRDGRAERILVYELRAKGCEGRKLVGHGSDIHGGDERYRASARIGSGDRAKAMTSNSKISRALWALRRACRPLMLQRLRPTDLLSNSTQSEKNGAVFYGK
jgi:hypothetical protein